MNTNSWMLRMEQALAAGGCLSQQEWAQKFPGVHCWFRFDEDPKRPWESCALCGVVRRADSNRPCKGIVRIELRDGKDSGGHE